MDCGKFKRNYAKYNLFPLERSITESDEYEEHIEHGQECDSCGKMEHVTNSNRKRRRRF